MIDKITEIWVAGCAKKGAMIKWAEFPPGKLARHPEPSLWAGNGGRYGLSVRLERTSRNERELIELRKHTGYTLNKH